MSSPVPTEWITDELVRFCDIVGGGTPDRAVHEYWGGQIPWVSPTEVTSLASKYISKTKEGLTQLGLDKSSAKLHPPGTLLMTSRASIGYVAINTVPMATNQGFQSLRCKDGTLADYMYQYITWVRPELERLSAGSTFSEISSVNVKRLRVTLPPRPEQQKIATILSSVDNVIEKTRAPIDKLKDLKTGMMQELLTKGIGHTEFKDSPVGFIPINWEVKQIGEMVVKVGSGITPRGGSASYVDVGIPLIRSQNVHSDGLRLDDVSYITETQHAKMSGSQLKSFDVLLNITGASIGRCYYLPPDFKEGNVNQHVCIIRLKQEVMDSVFLTFCLNSELGQRQVMSLQAGGNREGLNFQQVRAIRLAVPPIDEQKRIAEIVSSIEKNIRNKLAKLAHLSDTKKALMQDLLTGKVRVNLTDKESAVV